jgi:hypothetical protein
MDFSAWAPLFDPDHPENVVLTLLAALVAGWVAGSIAVALSMVYHRR